MQGDDDLKIWDDETEAGAAQALVDEEEFPASVHATVLE